MSVRSLVLVKPDATVICAHLNPNNRLAGETDAEFETRGFARTVQANNWGAYGQFLIDRATLPADRSKREAWVWNGSAVVVDPAKEAPIVTAAARCATDAAECLQAKLDAATMALVNATPAQLITYAQNNFPSLTVAERNKMGAILQILAVAVRPHVR